jgi:hypothetical protein
MPTVAPPADDPIATVAYESWMFIETTDLALNHWDDFPNIVVQHAIVEDAVLHARSLCEVIVSSSDPDSITLKKLFPDLDTNINKFKVLRELKKQLAIEYDQDKSPSYRELFNSRVMHPSILRGDYGQYGEPLRRLRPKIFAVVREIAALTGYPFSLPPMS